MVTINVTEVGSTLDKIWSAASNGPVSILSAGQAVAVVMLPADYEKLTARRHGAKAGFAKPLFTGVDMNALLEVSIDDVFEDYQ